MYGLVPWVVLAFRVPLQLRRVEVDLSQIARGVTFRLVIEVWRLRVAAFAAGRHGSRVHRRAELDNRDEAVAADTVDLLAALARPSGERRQRSQRGGREVHRDARLRVVERMDEIVRDALEAIDVAPW